MAKQYDEAIKEISCKMKLKQVSWKSASIIERMSRAHALLVALTTLLNIEKPNGTSDLLDDIRRMRTRLEQSLCAHIFTPGQISEANLPGEGWEGQVNGILGNGELAFMFTGKSSIIAVSEFSLDDFLKQLPRKCPSSHKAQTLRHEALEAYIRAEVAKTIARNVYVPLTRVPGLSVKAQHALMGCDFANPGKLHQLTIQCQTLKEHFDGLNQSILDTDGQLGDKFTELKNKKSELASGSVSNIINSLKIQAKFGWSGELQPLLKVLQLFIANPEQYLVSKIKTLLNRLIESKKISRSTFFSLSSAAKDKDNAATAILKLFNSLLKEINPVCEAENTYSSHEEAELKKNVFGKAGAFLDCLEKDISPCVTHVHSLSHIYDQARDKSKSMTGTGSATQSTSRSVRLSEGNEITKVPGHTKGLKLTRRLSYLAKILSTHGYPGIYPQSVYDAIQTLLFTVSSGGYISNMSKLDTDIRKVCATIMSGPVQGQLVEKYSLPILLQGEVLFKGGDLKYDLPLIMYQQDQIIKCSQNKFYGAYATAYTQHAKENSPQTRLVERREKARLRLHILVSLLADTRYKEFIPKGVCDLLKVPNLYGNKELLSKQVEGCSLDQLSDSNSSSWLSSTRAILMKNIDNVEDNSITVVEKEIKELNKILDDCMAHFKGNQYALFLYKKDIISSDADYYWRDKSLGKVDWPLFLTLLKEIVERNSEKNGIGNPFEDADNFKKILQQDSTAIISRSESVSRETLNTNDDNNIIINNPNNNSIISKVDDSDASMGVPGLLRSTVQPKVQSNEQLDLPPPPTTAPPPPPAIKKMPAAQPGRANLLEAIRQADNKNNLKKVDKMQKKSAPTPTTGGGVLFNALSAALQQRNKSISGVNNNDNNWDDTCSNN